MTENTINVKRIRDNRERGQRWIAVTLNLSVKGHHVRLHGQTGESWYIGHHRYSPIRTLAMQMVHVLLSFATDTGFLSGEHLWPEVYEEIGNLCLNVAQEIREMQNERSVKDGSNGENQNDGEK